MNEGATGRSTRTKDQTDRHTGITVHDAHAAAAMRQTTSLPTTLFPNLSDGRSWSLEKFFEWHSVDLRCSFDGQGPSRMRYVARHVSCLHIS
jgi:hypothetical protein